MSFIRRSACTRPTGACRMRRNSARLAGSARKRGVDAVARACHSARVVRAVMPFRSGRSVITTNISSIADGAVSNVSSSRMSMKPLTSLKCSLIATATAGCGNSCASMFCSRMVLSWVTVLAAQ